MAIAVQFPDGSVRDVPGQLRLLALGRDSRTPPTYEQVPLNCDSRWIYGRIDGRWIARPRLGQVAVLRPVIPEWWVAIVQMNDIAPPDDPDRLHSAA